MSYGHFILSALAATAAYYVLGFALNGLWLAKDFGPYHALFRTREAIMSRMPLGMVGTFVAALVLTVLFAAGYHGGSAIWEGTRFGLLIGVLVTFTHLAENYVTLPFGNAFTVKLAIAALVQWVVVGIVIALISAPPLLNSIRATQ